MSFGVTPVSSYAPPVDAGFPKFLQWQEDGTDVGDTLVQTVNITGDAALSLSSDGGTLTIDVDGGGAGGFTWNEVAGDYDLTAEDMNKGVATIGTSGAQIILVPTDADVPVDFGATVLVLQEEDAQAQIVGDVGVELIYRPFAFNPSTAGKGAILSIINRGPDRWIICGDLEQVS